MPPISRRFFLARLAAAVPLAVVVRRAHALSVDALASEQRASRTLHALGSVVLPSELTPTGITRVVQGFQRWIAGYREHAELTHGYGTSRIRFTGPTPATRWASQLDELDAAARRRHGKPFAQLAPSNAEALVRDVLAGEALDRLPSVVDAKHVAIALLAYFFDSSEATDLCYGALIGRQTCRPLAQSAPMPVALSARRLRS